MVSSPGFVSGTNTANEHRLNRDSEDSAPAEFPPEQPDVDQQDDDGAAYGAEEVELETALQRELEETEKELAEGDKNGDDQEMEGAADTSGAKADEEEEASDAESEDLEAESSDDDDDEDLEEEGEGEGDGDEEMDMGEDGAAASGASGEHAQQHPEVMVH